MTARAVQSTCLVLFAWLALGCGRRGNDSRVTHKSAPTASTLALGRDRLGASAGAGGSDGDAGTTETAPWLENTWDPQTGRGRVIHHQPGLGTLQTSFHVGYPGYTGGLVIGGYSSSGLAWIPEHPTPGFPSINVFCAQDESIWDRGEHREYTYGWSENFGTGSDGERLEYVSGRVLEASRERLVLESENKGGCYQIRKLASTWADTRYWIVATRVTNRCGHTVKFDFFSGDDPWIGLYKSSDGDVGWTSTAKVRNEAHVPFGEFVAGGLWDLGNAALGQTEGAFSNQADFVALDPTLALPNEVNFANRFAHGKAEVDSSRPLDNHSMTALNLGWTRQQLAPNASLDYVFALGLADMDADSALPRPPELRDEHWSRWRHYLPPKSGSIRESAEFVSELVELDVSAERLQVRGTYYVYNPTRASAAFTIGFPINVAADRPAPQSVSIDNRELSVSPESSGRVSVNFPISIPAQSLRSFRVSYTQQHRGRHAEYVVTSARTWKRPLARAVFRITATGVGPIRTSYAAQSSRIVDGKQTVTIVRQPFVPDREMIVTW